MGASKRGQAHGEKSMASWNEIAPQEVVGRVWIDRYLRAQSPEPIESLARSGGRTERSRRAANYDGVRTINEGLRRSPAVHDLHTTRTAKDSPCIARAETGQRTAVTAVDPEANRGSYRGAAAEDARSDRQRERGAGGHPGREESRSRRLPQYGWPGIPSDRKPASTIFVAVRNGREAAGAKPSPAPGHRDAMERFRLPNRDSSCERRYPGLRGVSDRHEVIERQTAKARAKD